MEAPATLEALLAQTRQPQFIDSAYFLRFKFEQGKYALVGRESFDGTEVLRIEYYPARLFRTPGSRRAAPADGAPSRDIEEAMERLMNKVSLVTLWVTPGSHQIVKYTFDNVNLDFLPAAWLVRVSDIKATMTMSQPFKDCGCRAMWSRRVAMLAIGAVDVSYHLDYDNYREATTGGRINAKPAAVIPALVASDMW